MDINYNQDRVLDLKDVTIMIVTDNFGILWIPVVACLGASAIFFWILGAVMFFLPLVMIAVQLSRKHPGERGYLYSYTVRALGQKASFMVAWLYWVNTIFYYPIVFIF